MNFNLCLGTHEIRCQPTLAPALTNCSLPKLGDRNCLHYGVMPAEGSRNARLDNKRRGALHVHIVPSTRQMFAVMARCRHRALAMLRIPPPLLRRRDLCLLLLRAAARLLRLSLQLRLLLGSNTLGLLSRDNADSMLLLQRCTLRVRLFELIV